MAKLRPIRTPVGRSLALGVAAACAVGAAAQAQILGGGGLPGLPGGGIGGGAGSIGGTIGGLGPQAMPAPPRPPRLPARLPDSAAPATGLSAAAGAALAVPDAAPRLLGSLPRDIGALPPAAVDLASDLAEAPLTEVRRLRVERLLRDYPAVVEADERGQPVVRGEILALVGSADAAARIRRAGFTIRSREALTGLGLQSLVIAAPSGTSAAEALRRLRQADPTGQYDYNHLYQEGGTLAVQSAGAAAASSAAEGRGLRIGLVDGAVAARQPTLAGARLVQRGFAPGGTRPTAHATAVASLIAGARGRFRGAAPGATLYVADVYGPTPTGGSAEAIARGLSWLAQNRVPVINISLVGPPNLLLKSAVEALVARGHLVVAAVGNDGPAAPPLYPAAYPGVVAVTGVDARQRVLPEAGRGTHVDFAAPGDLAAAGLGGEFVRVRGTSFAAPVTAGRLAGLLAAPDRARAARAVETLGRQATDLGARGPDAVYGRGLVGFDLRTDPAAVNARTALRGP